MSTANDTIIDIGSKLEARINNLTPGKVYKLRVLAYSNGGDGRMSSPAHTFQMGKMKFLYFYTTCIYVPSLLVLKAKTVFYLNLLTNFK